MVHYSCDQCGAALADESPWMQLVQNVIVDDEWDEVVQHFCAIDCLAAWAFGLAAEHAR